MAIDFGKDDERQETPAARRQLPIGDLAVTVEVLGHEELEEGAQEALTVTQAAKGGFLEGFSDSLKAGAPVNALVEVAEAAETGQTKAADVVQRMDRFPELRDLEVATGNAARFPELAEQDLPAVGQQLEEDAGLQR